jgi:MFS family permease
VTLGLALIADTVGEKRIGFTMAWVSIQLNVGLMLGPLLGGIVYDEVGWYGTFAVGFAVLGLDLLLRIIIIEKHVAARYLTTTENGDKVMEEDLMRRGVHESVVYRDVWMPEVISLLTHARMLAGMWLAFAQATIISAFDAALPLHLNQIFGWTSFQAGCIIIFLLI